MNTEKFLETIDNLIDAINKINPGNLYAMYNYDKVFVKDGFLSQKFLVLSNHCKETFTVQICQIPAAYAYFIYPENLRDMKQTDMDNAKTETELIEKITDHFTELQ